MARARRLDDMRADVRYQCDQQGATLRHTDPNLTRLLNQSIQRFRLRISRDAKLPYYLTKATGTLTAGAVSANEPWSLLTHGLNLVWIRSLSVTYDNETIPLEEVAFDALHEFQTGGNTGTPRAFTMPNTTDIYILPASSGAYPYVLFYLPPGTDLSADGDTFDGIAGWEDWVIFDTCTRVLLRDDHPEQIGAFEGFKSDVWNDIMAAKEMGRAGPHKRIDVRGRRDLGRYLSRWRT